MESTPTRARSATPYATAAVSAANDGSAVGGLVGYNDGTLTNAYATGAVTASGVDSAAGGLVGYSDSAISKVYATGAVIGRNGAIVGGLLGANDGTIGSAYWDTQTSGTAVGIGEDDEGQTATGLTTAQLQGGISSLDRPSAAGRAACIHIWRASTPTGCRRSQVLRTRDAGVTPLASGANGVNLVSGLVNGGASVTATTGANGYYYLLEPAGTIAAAGSSVITYSSTANGSLDSAVDGARVVQATGTVDHVDIWGRLPDAVERRDDVFRGMAVGR